MRGKQVRLVDGGAELQLRRRVGIVSAVSPGGGVIYNNGATGSDLGDWYDLCFSFMVKSSSYKPYFFAAFSTCLCVAIRQCICLPPLVCSYLHVQIAEQLRPVKSQCGDSTASLQSWTVGFTKYAYSGALMLRALRAIISDQGSPGGR